MRHLVRCMVFVSVCFALASQALANCNNMAVVAPSNGDSGVSRNLANTVTVKWTAQEGSPDFYDVYFGPVGSGCTAPPHGTTAMTEWSPPSNEITPGASYEWMAVARSGGISGCAPPPMTTCSTFTVASCPVAPTISAPANNSTVSYGSVVLDWDNVPGATTYEVYVGLDGDPLSSRGSTVQSTKSIAIEPGRTVEWKVVANAASCSGAASAHSFFTTTCPANAPSPISPASGATFTAGQNVNFSWSFLAGAAGYDVKVSSDGGNNWTVIAENLTNNFYSTDDLQQGQYLWEVRANFNGDCDPLYSQPRQFAIVTNCTGLAPELLSPAANATVARPVTFRWTARANVTAYRLFVRHSTENAPRLLTTTSNTEYTTSDLEPGGNEWAVEAIYGECADATSASRIVNVEGGQDDNGCPSNPGKATLTAPVSNATNLSSPVTFKWNAVSKATSYRVLASFNDGAAVSLGGTTATQLTAGVPAGTGYWIVQTFFGDDCPTTLSERRALTITTGETCSGTAPQLIAPVNGALTVHSPVAFTWSAVSKATRYRLFVAAGDDEFSFYGETTETSLERLVPAGVVKWFVIAGFTACPDARSSTSSFVVRDAESCANATISLLSPADNATTGSPVHMTWTPVAGALFYRVWVAVDGDAPVNVLRTNATEADVSLPAGTIGWYVDAPRQDCDAVVSDKRRFTIAKGANCDSNVAPTLVSPLGTRENPAAVNRNVTLNWNAVANAIGYRIWLSRDQRSFEDIALTKLTHVEIELDGGLYSWYAQALYEACPSLSSATTFFRVGQASCPTDQPSIVSPGENALAASPVTFVWTAVTNAVKYRVFVSIDGSDAQLIGSTEATQLARTLPPGHVTWRVEAVFKECPSTFSELVHLTIEQSQNCGTDVAALVAPANDATNVASPVDFVWSAVSGAVKYVLIAQVNDGAPTALVATTDTHYTHTMPPGTIRWHVVTFFSGCEPLESEHFRFTIPREQNCDNRKPILLLPSDDRRALPSPVHFEWTAVPNAIKYLLWARQGDTEPAIIASTTDSNADVELPEGRYEYFVEAQFASCQSTRSARGEFTVTPPVPCGKPLQPQAQVVGQAQSNTKYRLRWTPLPNVQFYEVQEATALDFSNATTFTTAVPVLPFVHEVTGAPVQYLYRVRGVSDCAEGDRGPYSDTVGVFVVASKTNNASAEIGDDSVVVQKVFVPGSAAAVQFTATSDKPWITITPSSGTLPVEGITLVVTADPAFLSLGTNTGTINITYGGSSAKGAETNAGTTLKIPTSITLVTPVEPTGKGTPPPDSLIFPIVGHATGANDSLFESDIRVTNLTADTMRYDVHFTPSNSDGTQTGSSSTIEIAPNSTMALDDIVASLFGTGTTSSATGMLEVRPLTTESSPNVGFFGSTGVASTIRALTTAASSRTYNFTSEGTYGQYIPAVRFADFVGKSPAGEPASILSLQQVAQSSAFRANFGFAEASGAPADLSVRVYDTASTLLATIPLSLQAGEHRQLNGMLATYGITSLTDGRVEVEVVNGEGKVTAYVSELDNRTNDPLLVSAVHKGAITASKYVVPGVAYINNPSAFWVTDMRVFNAGTTDTPATLTFYAEREPGVSLSKQITLQAGEIKVLDNVLSAMFAEVGRPTGSIAVTTPSDTNLIVTARTYNSTTKGTYGQFVPGITPAESIGIDDRALQLLQLEQSSRLRTNIGLNETAGQSVTIEVSAVIPDSLVTPVVTYTLQPNEFRQISLAEFAPGVALYNTRVTVKVVGGAGRVTAYGSAIDEKSGDPTYIPAQ
jgi:hypothetical protein